MKIKICDVSKELNRQIVLNRINLEISSGEIFVILGESGAGKSVLLQHLIGLFKPDRGQIFIDKTDIVPLVEKELLPVRRQIGYLFQDGALYDFMNVFENVAFPLEEHTALSPSEIAKKVFGLLAEVGLKGGEFKFPSQLSGGMRKRAALARAVILGSKVLFCDEPTSGLDPLRSRQISDLIQSLARKTHCTTVITSHDVRNAFRIADRLAIMKDGQLAIVGTQAQLQASSDPFVREFIG